MRRQSLNPLEKLAGNHNICELSQNISSLADILLLPSNFSEFENYGLSNTD